MVAPTGIEPVTQGFSVLCSTNWAMVPKKMAVPKGFEPSIFCVTGRRDRPLHYGTIGCGRRIWTYDLRVMSPTSYRAAPSRDKYINGGGKGIRTPAPLARPIGFQDRSLQPDLGIPPATIWLYHSRFSYVNWKKCLFNNFFFKIGKNIKKVLIILDFNIILNMSYWLRQVPLPKWRNR